nr:zinc finger, CCHC-type [Tanacetum cinerariifolium]
MPSLLSPEPTVSCFDDLDFFNDFEIEFPAIVYNDARMSKSDLSTEFILSPQHINGFNLKDETSLSEYKDNDDDKVDIEHSSRDLSVKPLHDLIQGGSEQSHVSISSLRVCMYGLCRPPGILVNLDNSTSNVLIPLDSWTSGLLVYKEPLSRSISTWEDLTTRFLAQFFPTGRTAKLHNDILIFQQHYEESHSEALTRLKDSLQKVPHHGIDLWLQV